MSSTADGRQHQLGSELELELVMKNSSGSERVPVRHRASRDTEQTAAACACGFWMSRTANRPAFATRYSITAVFSSRVYKNGGQSVIWRSADAPPKLFAPEGVSKSGETVRLMDNKSHSRPRKAGKPREL